jgi:hypothetical protein
MQIDYCEISALGPQLLGDTAADAAGGACHKRDLPD